MGVPVPGTSTGPGRVTWTDSRRVRLDCRHPARRPVTAGARLGVPQPGTCTGAGREPFHVRCGCCRGHHPAGHPRGTAAVRVPAATCGACTMAWPYGRATCHRRRSAATGTGPACRPGAGIVARLRLPGGHPAGHPRAAAPVCVAFPAARQCPARAARPDRRRVRIPRRHPAGLPEFTCPAPGPAACPAASCAVARICVHQHHPARRRRAAAAVRVAQPGTSPCPAR